jgi:F-type H+-transporting ATPase subunit epsilon
VSSSSLRLRIVTPVKMTEKEIQRIRLKDGTGFFGIMKDHTDFLTVLEPSLCYYTDAEGKEFFLAIDGGILSIREGVVTLTSREVYESGDADKLAAIIHSAVVKRDESETALRGMLEGIEKAFLEKSIAFIKRRPR